MNKFVLAQLHHIRSYARTIIFFRPEMRGKQSDDFTYGTMPVYQIPDSSAMFFQPYADIGRHPFGQQEALHPFALEPRIGEHNALTFPLSRYMPATNRNRIQQTYLPFGHPRYIFIHPSSVIRNKTLSLYIRFFQAKSFFPVHYLKNKS